jgi:N-acetylmuramoyl-L-alanine amidase
MKTRLSTALCGALLLLVTLAGSVRPAVADVSELQAVRVATEQGTTRVFFDLSEAVPHRFFTLEDPRRAVLDLEGVSERVVGALPAAQGSVLRVRTGPQPDGILRVVIELRSGSRATLQPALSRSPRGQRLVLEVAGEGEPGGSGPAATNVAAASNVAAAGDVPDPVPLKPVKAAHAPPVQGRVVVVAIDPGHGGQDPGAIGPGGTKEKVVVLDIAKQLAARIDREPGMRAVLTRDGDVFLSLRERIRRARAAGAELFVSVHADAVPNREVTGSSVYVLSDKGATDEQARWLADRENAADLVGGISLDDKDPALASVLVDLTQGAQIWQSMTAAERVLRSLGRVNTVRKPQVQQAGFVVLKSPDIPSMLVETAFISSPEDERLLGIPERRTALAEAIFDGVRQYFTDHPPDGSRFAMERDAGRTVLATGAAEAPGGGAKTPGATPPAGRL